MDLLSNLAVVAVGISAGVLGSLLGLGGGFIIVPTLVFMGMEPERIAGTSMFTVISTSASSTLSYAIQRVNGVKGGDAGDDNRYSDGSRGYGNGRRRSAIIDSAIALRLVIFAVPGTVLGAYSSSMLDISSFKLYFALLLAGVAVHMLMNPYYHVKERHYPRQISYASGFLSGFVASLFGVGGGAILVPVMLMVLRLSMHVTVPTVHLIILISSVSAVAAHILLGHPDYTVAALLVGSTFLGAQIGSRLLGRIRDMLLRRLVAIALVAVAARLIQDAIA